jgi:hypothetical protein
MRSKVVLSASALALLILAPAIYFHFAPGSTPPDQSAPAPEPVAVAPAPAPVAAPIMPHHRAIAPVNGGEGVAAPDDSSASNPEDRIATRQGELTQLGMSDDPADLKTILSELNNKAPEIRSAALAAAVQFGSKDAIPALQNEMAWADDPQEKVDILNAIKYLQLPSIDEYQAALAAAPPPSSDQPAPTN